MRTRRATFERRSLQQRGSVLTRRARRRYVLMGAVLAAGAVLMSLLLPAGSNRPAGYWATPLPASVRVEGDSTMIVEHLLVQIARRGGVGVNDGAYGIPVFSVPRDQTTVAVSPSPGCGDFTPDTGVRVPIPPGAHPASGSDGSLVIAQPSSATEWEFWRAQEHPGGWWSACWGGRLTGAQARRGIFPSPFGLAASGISYLDTVITERDAAAGRIDHVLAINVIECNSSVAPADRTDCGFAPGQPPEGSWLRLPASLPMPSGMTRMGRMVFRALQKYGAVVTDHAGAVMVEAEAVADWYEQGHRGLAPITASFDGKPEYSALAGIPWTRLEVIAPRPPG